jgi:EAL domain-containing protein (putative c-di-GMP-specific phosphodiesterase class I)
MRTVGRRLTSTVRASDFVGRVGRNAFFVLCTDTRDAAEAMRLVQSLEDAFERELIWSVAGELSISLRCGLAIAERGDDPEAELRRAQLASTSTAAPVDFVEASEDPTLVAACEALRPAVMTGDVQTLVATVVDRTGRVAGYHAFPRWASAEFGVWESHRLDVIAQRAGVSTALTLQVLREAAAFVMTSPADATTSISVALAESLIQDAYVEQYLWEVVDAVGIAPGQIALLVDEAAMATSSSPAALRSLRETGAKIVATSLDQGSDVIGLVADHHCVDLWLSERIVDELETDGSARTAVSSLIALAHDIGARVTAPGVRTQPQHEVLLAAQVDFMTGAFFGAPTSAE